MSNSLIEVQNNVQSVSVVEIDSGYQINIVPNIEQSINITDVALQGLKGSKGDQGDSIQFTWSSTQLGIKTDKQTNYVFTDLKGDKGDVLEFDALTEQQKEQLRGDVGSTSTNLVNIFYDSLLS